MGLAFFGCIAPAFASRHAADPLGGAVPNAEGAGSCVGGFCFCKCCDGRCGGGGVGAAIGCGAAASRGCGGVQAEVAPDDDEGGAATGGEGGAATGGEGGAATGGEGGAATGDEGGAATGGEGGAATSDGGGPGGGGGGGDCAASLSSRCASSLKVGIGFAESSITEAGPSSPPSGWICAERRGLSRELRPLPLAIHPCLRLEGAGSSPPRQSSGGGGACSDGGGGGTSSCADGASSAGSTGGASSKVDGGSVFTDGAFSDDAGTLVAARAAGTSACCGGVELTLAGSGSVSAGGPAEVGSAPFAFSVISSASFAAFGVALS